MYILFHREKKSDNEIQRKYSKKTPFSINIHLCYNVFMQTGSHLQNRGPGKPWTYVESIEPICAAFHQCSPKPFIPQIDRLPTISSSQSYAHRSQYNISRYFRKLRNHKENILRETSYHDSMKIKDSSKFLFLRWSKISFIRKDK